MRFTPDFLDEIRARVPISSIVGSKVVFDTKKSSKSRGDFWACCPFHREKTPSFHCDDSRGRYHCFGCGASGDIFRFLTETEGTSFTQAVEQLAGIAGLSLPEYDENQKEEQRERVDLYEILEKAAGFFERELKQGHARPARDYLTQRGLDEATLRQFRLGFAPDARAALRDHLAKAGIRLEMIERAGLLINGEDVTVPYDRFRHRIIFPIRDIKKRVVGFGGRALASTARAKYLNSPEGELFHKGQMLYNLAAAREALHKTGQGVQREDNKTGLLSRSLIVVEGYMDVIALSKAGFPQVVAPLGTALTSEQLQLLWRFSDMPVLCFDGDNAGFSAALRALDRALPLLKTNFSLQFMLLPAGKDPDDIIRDGGKEAFHAKMTSTLPLAEMLWQREIIGKTFDTPEQRASLEKNLKKAIFTITDESLRHYYLQDMRARLRALFAPPRRDYAQKGNNIYGQQNRKAHGRFERSGHSSQNFHTPSPLSASKMLAPAGLPSREAAIAAMLANHPLLWEENFDTLERLEFENNRLHRLYQVMLDVLAEEQPEDGATMRKCLYERGKKSILEEIDLLMGQLGLRTATRVEGETVSFEDVRTTLKQALHLHMRARTLHKQLREIEANLLANPLNQHFAMLASVKAELEKTDATQALIHGFGD